MVGSDGNYALVGSDGNYAAHWRRLRLLAVASWTTYLGGFALVGLLMLNTAVPAGVLFVGWVVACFVVVSKHDNFLCPRCRGHFFRPTVWSKNSFQKACPHCGLPKWARHG